MPIQRQAVLRPAGGGARGGPPRVAVEADRAGPAAFGRPSNTLTTHDGGGPTQGDLGRVQVHGSGFAKPLRFLYVRASEE